MLIAASAEVQGQPANEQLVAPERLQELLGSDMDSSLLQFVAEQKLLEDIELQQIIPAESWKSLFATEQKEENKFFQLIPPSASVGAFYANVPQTDSTVDNGPTFFKQLAVDGGCQIAGVPIQLNGRAVFNQFNWQKKMSSVSISFQHQAFLDRFSRELYPDWSIDADLPSVDAPEMPGKDLKTMEQPSLKAADRQIIQQEVRFLLYQKIIAHPKFIKMLEGRDSIQSTPIIDPADAAEEKQSQAQDLLNKYRQSWEQRKTYYGDSLQQVKQKIDRHYKRLDAFQNPDLLRKEILRTQKLKPLQKLLLFSKDIKIGRSVVQDSWYTAENLPINGFQYGFAAGKWEGQIAIGRQVFNNHFSPAWGSNLFHQIDGGQVLFAKATYELTKQTELTYSFLRLKEKGRFSTPYVIAPQNNVVFSVGGQADLHRGIGIRSEWSFSRSVWGQPDVAVDNRISRRNIAGEITMTGQWNKNNLETEIGYFYIGPDFISAGNPFMQNNRQGTVGKARGQMGKRIQVEAEMRLGKSIDQRAVAGGRQRDWQMIGSVHCKLLKDVILSAQVSPNYFRQFGTGEVAISHHNMLYQLFVQSQHSMGDRLLTQAVGMSNFHSNLHLTDSSSTNLSRQVYWQSSLALSPSRSLSVLSLWGIHQGQKPTAGKQHAFFTEVGYGWQGDKLHIRSAGQLVKDASLDSWYIGTTQSIQFQLSKNTQFAVDFSYQLPTQAKGTTARPRYWGSIELIQQFY